MRKCLLLAGLAFTFAAATSAESRESLDWHTYILPGGGAVLLEVPASWNEEIRQKDRSLPPTVVFRPKKGKQFEILFTPIPSKSEQSAGMADIEASLIQGGKQHLPTAVQGSILLETLEGPQARGRYYLLTEKHPPPNEYPNVIAGVLLVGPVVASFTVLLHEPSGSEAQQALGVLKSATFQSGHFGVYRATLEDLRLKMLLAEAAGLTAETLIDDKGLYRVGLGGFLVEARPLDRRTIRVRVDGENSDEAGALLEALTIGFAKID